MGTTNDYLTKSRNLLVDFFQNELSLDCKLQSCSKGACSFTCSDTSDEGNDYLVSVSDVYLGANSDLNCILNDDLIVCAAKGNDFRLYFSFEDNNVSLDFAHVVAPYDSITGKNFSLIGIFESLDLFWVPSSW